ncbi:MAG: YHS domain-containing protein [bacterium]|nr:YHS domain-containing protein [bacterium]
MIIRLLRLLMLAVVGYVLYRVLWKGEGLDFFRSKKKKSTGKAPLKMRKDPVCGTYLPEDQAVMLRRKRDTFYFCSEECKKKFQLPAE